MITRVLTSLAFSIIMFFSIRSLGFDTNKALIASLIPLLPGVFNVAAGLAYSSTSLVMILAIAAHLMPEQLTMIKNASKKIHSAIHNDSKSTPQAAPQGQNQTSQ